jgi:hypothetical protein
VPPIAGSAQATFAARTLGRGIHSITATYNGDAYHRPSTSAIVTLKIINPVPPPVPGPIPMPLPSTGSMGPSPAVTAIASEGVHNPSAGGPSPSASIPLDAGSTVIVPLDPSGPAAWSTKVPSLAQHTITAGDAAGVGLGGGTPGGPVGFLPGAWRRRLPASAGSGRKLVVTTERLSAAF